MSFRSPGVYSTESQTRRAKRQSNQARAAFVGNFEKGPVGQAFVVTSVEELIENFGYPNDVTYNDWFQVFRFLQYYPACLAVRASNLEHTFDECAQIDSDITVTVETDYRSLEINGANPFGIKPQQIKNLQSTFKQFDRFTIEGDNADRGAIYTVMDPEAFSFVPKLKHDVFSGQRILRLSGVVNASIEMPTDAQYMQTPTNMPNGIPANEPFIESEDAFNLYNDSFAVNNIQTPLTIWARSPGNWGNGLQIAIVGPEDFKVNYSASTVKQAKLAFAGVVVDNAFRQAPNQGQVGVLVSLNNKIVEQFIVGQDPSSPNFIEDEINQKSKYIFVRRGIGPIYSTAFASADIKRPLTLVGGKDSEVSVDDIKKATNVFLDKDTYKFDVIISNELDKGLSAKNLAVQRSDIISITGADLSLFAMRDGAKTVDNLVDFRQHILTIDGCACRAEGAESTVNAQVFQDSHAVFVGNYLVVHDPYNNKQRLINIAGDIAGLRCETNSNFGEWKASAGVNRGVLKSGARLVFNPTQPQRDIMYAHNINPVIAMNDVGNVMWGNRTMARLDDDFLSMHIRSMTNMLVRGSNYTLQQFVMENINTYSMHSVVASLSPLFNSVKAGGGLLDYYIVCDYTNNSDESMMNNQLYVDVYFRPTGVAEYICLRMNNTGSETIASVVEREQLRQPGAQVHPMNH